VQRIRGSIRSRMSLRSGSNPITFFIIFKVIMMVDLTDQVNGVTLTVARVKALLDQPSSDFLKNDSVEQILVRSYNWVIGKIDVSDYSGQSITDAIYSLTVWQCYMIYVESISEYFKQQQPTIILERADDFRKVAMLYLEAIGIVWPLDKDGQLDFKDIKAVNAKFGFSPAAGVLTLNNVYSGV